MLLRHGRRHEKGLKMTEVGKPLLWNFVSSLTDKTEVLTPFMERGGWGDRRVFRLPVFNIHIEFRYVNDFLWPSKQQQLASSMLPTCGPQNYKPDFDFGQTMCVSWLLCLKRLPSPASKNPTLLDPFHLLRRHWDLRQQRQCLDCMGGRLWSKFLTWISSFQPPPLLAEGSLFPF